MSKSTRDEIRKALLGNTQKYKSKIVKFNNAEIEVRQVSIADKNEFLNKSKDKNTLQYDELKLQVNAIISSCYTPGTDERVFEDTDYNVISGCVIGGYADILWKAIEQLNEFQVDAAKKN